MVASSSFLEHLQDCLRSLGPTKIRRMFGGAGIYADGVMFGLVANDVLYFKVDDENVAAFVAEELPPFTYDGKAKPIEMSYRRVPERLFDDAEEMIEWARPALAAARRAAAKKKPKSKIKKRKVVSKKAK